MKPDRLREWLSEVLPARGAGALLALGSGDIQTSDDGRLVAPLALARIDADGAVLDVVEESLAIAYAEDLDGPERTRAYLRAWSRWAAGRIGEGVMPIDLAPHTHVLDDLGNQSEGDFFCALDDRTNWDSRPDATIPYPHDLSDLSEATPLARSEEHESALLDTLDPAAFDRYARWLAERGDPRGEVGVLEAEGTRAAVRRARKIVADRVRYFFGPLPGTRRETWIWEATFELELRCGWIRRARVDLADAAEYAGLDRIEALRALLRIPGARFLEHLDVVDDTPTLAALEAAGGHACVRELRVACGRESEPHLRRLFPRVRKIEYDGERA